MTEAQLYRRLRIAGGLVLVGLLVQLATLVSDSPAAFLVFLFLGAGCVTVGVLGYLLLVARQAPALAASTGQPGEPAPAPGVAEASEPPSEAEPAEPAEGADAAEPGDEADDAEDGARN